MISMTGKLRQHLRPALSRDFVLRALKLSSTRFRLFWGSRYKARKPLCLVSCIGPPDTRWRPVRPSCIGFPNAQRSLFLRQHRTLGSHFITRYNIHHIVFSTGGSMLHHSRHHRHRLRLPFSSLHEHLTWWPTNLLETEHIYPDGPPLVPSGSSDPSDVALFAWPDYSCSWGGPSEPLEWASSFHIDQQFWTS